MSEPKTKYLALKYQIKDLESKILNANKKLYQLRDELQKECPHNQIREDYVYYEGGYLEQAQSRTDIYCSFCGKLLKTGEITYGGFN